MATLGLCAAIHRNPLQLFKEWMGVSEYFLSGMFTLQELITWFGFRGTIWSAVITAAALVFLVGVVAVYRRRPIVDLFAFLSVGSVLWIYHKYYDFIMVMPALLIMLDRTGEDLHPGASGSDSSARRSLSLAISLLLILFISLIPYANYADGTWPRMIRWGGRVSLVALLGMMLVRLVRRPAPRDNGLDLTTQISRHSG